MQSWCWDKNNINLYGDEDKSKLITKEGERNVLIINIHFLLTILLNILL